MSDETPPWEQPDAVRARIEASYEEQERRRLAENDAIMDRTLDMAEHLPDYDLDGDCCSGTTLYITGCSCGVTGVHDEESWKAHVTEVQRRDRAVTWERGYMRSHSLDRGWDTHEAPVPDRLYLDGDNPYRDDTDPNKEAE